MSFSIPKDTMDNYMTDISSYSRVSELEEKSILLQLNNKKDEFIVYSLQKFCGRKILLEIFQSIKNRDISGSKLINNFDVNSVDDFIKELQISLDNKEKFIKKVFDYSYNLNIIKHILEKFEELSYSYQTPINEIKRFLLKNGIPPLSLNKLEEIINSPLRLLNISEFSDDKFESIRTVTKKKIEKYILIKNIIDLNINISNDELNKFTRDLNRKNREMMKIKDILIAANLRLVISIAKKYRTSFLPIEDLIQEGNIGLIKSIDRFDHNKGNKLSTYATWWIKQAITRSLEEKLRIIRLPSHIIEITSKIRKIQNDYFIKNGKMPDEKFIVSKFKFDKKELRFYMSICETSFSLDKQIDVNSDNELYNVIPDKNASNPLKNVEEKILSDRLSKILQKLTQKENIVLLHRFGLEGEYKKTLGELGKDLSLTRERVRQIERNALYKLKSMKDCKDLICFLNA